MARLGHAPWYFNCSRTRLTHVPLYKGHKLFLETRTILQRINCFSCTYLTAHPMPYIFLCLTFSCALHFLVPYIFLCLTFSYGLHFLGLTSWLTFSYGSTWPHFLVPYIFLWLTFSCALHFLVPYIFFALWLNVIHFLVSYIFLAYTYAPYICAFGLATYAICCRFRLFSFFRFLFGLFFNFILVSIKFLILFGFNCDFHLFLTFLMFKYK